MAECIERSAIKYEQLAVGPLNEPVMVVRKKTIDAIPAADVAPVVRCKSCKHSKWSDKNKSYYCKRRWAMHKVRERDFCSYGKRRTDEDDKSLTK